MLLRTIGALPVPPLLACRKRPIASCFGGGGSFGIGFGMGVVAGLKDAGIPVDQGPMLGTSAGSWTAASVAAGVTHDDLLGLSKFYEPTDDPVRVIDMTRAIFGEHRDERVSGVVLELPLGVFLERRVLFGRCGFDGVLLAHSCCGGSLDRGRLAGLLRVDGGLLAPLTLLSLKRFALAGVAFVGLPQDGTRSLGRALVAGARGNLLEIGPIADAIDGGGRGLTELAVQRHAEDFPRVS